MDTQMKFIKTILIGFLLTGSSIASAGIIFGSLSYESGVKDYNVVTVNIRGQSHLLTRFSLFMTPPHNPFNKKG